MNKQTRVSNSMYCFLPTEVEGFGPLVELALDTLGRLHNHRESQHCPAFAEVDQ